MGKVTQEVIIVVIFLSNDEQIDGTRRQISLFFFLIILVHPARVMILLSKFLGLFHFATMMTVVESSCFHSTFFLFLRYLPHSVNLLLDDTAPPPKEGRRSYITLYSWAILEMSLGMLHFE